MGKKNRSHPPAEEELFNVESILEHRGEGRKMQFLVRWEGNDPSQDSWEPISHLKDNTVWQAYVQEHRIDVHAKPPPKEERQEPMVRLTAKISDRLNRARNERLYLLSQADATTTRTGLARKYAVLGTTGNVYNVKICKTPSCTCPDCRKGHICKHIMLVMLKVLKVEKTSLAYQPCLLQAELAEIFAKAPPVPSTGVTAPQVVVAAYEEATGTGTGTGSGSAKKNASTPDDTEADGAGGEECECPICFEPVVRANEALQRCGTCRKHIHTDCIQRWLQHGQHCPMCRGPWCVVVADRGVVVSSKKRGRGEGGGYLNITTGDEEPSRYRYDDYDFW